MAVILRSFFSYGSSLVPICDCGSCLLPQADERIMEQALVNEDVMNARIYQFPTSAIKLDGRKINYYDFLMSAEEPQCNAAIQRIDKIVIIFLFMIVAPLITYIIQNILTN